MTIRVPSRVPGSDFEAVLHPMWEPGNPGSPIDEQWERAARIFANDRLRKVTEKWTGSRLVDHCAATELAINSELARPENIDEPINVTVTGHIALTPASGSESAQTDYTASLRAERIRNDRLADRLAFHKHVFSRPENAWLWWIDQHPEKIQAITKESFQFILSSFEEQNATENSDEDSYAKVITDFLRETDPSHATYAIGMLRQYLKYFDKFDLVDRVETLAEGRADDHLSDSGTE